MATLVVNASYSALLVGDAVASYATIHDQANANSIYTNDGWVGQAYYVSGGVHYQINRNGFIFNTSALGAGATITAVTLDLYGQGGDTSGSEFNIIVIDGADFQNPAVVADYGQLLDDTLSCGTFASASWVLTGYNSITLNANGIALINKVGDTKMAVRSSRDISSTAPTASDPFYEYLEFWSHIDAGKEPRLTITYTSGFIPKVTII